VLAHDFLPGASRQFEICAVEIDRCQCHVQMRLTLRIVVGLEEILRLVLVARLEAGLDARDFFM